MLFLSGEEVNVTPQTEVQSRKQAYNTKYTIEMLTFSYSDHISSASRKVLKFIKESWIYKNNSKTESYCLLPFVALGKN